MTAFWVRDSFLGMTTMKSCVENWMGFLSVFQNTDTTLSYMKLFKYYYLSFEDFLWILPPPPQAHTAGGEVGDDQR